jgi:hypothetical protein
VDVRSFSFSVIGRQEHGDVEILGLMRERDMESEHGLEGSTVIVEKLVR